MATTVFVHKTTGVKPDGPHTVVEVQEVDGSGNPVDSGGGSAEIAAGSVTTEKLADNAVTSSKIKSGNVTGYNIANGTVTADKLASGVLPTNATKEKPGLVKQAAHVDGASGTVQQIVDSLVAAGIMAGE